MQSRFLFVVVAAAALSGCVSVQKVRTGPVLPSRSEDAPVRVLSQFPQERYTEIGLLETQVDGSTPQSYVIEAFQKAARELGAEAIVMTGEQLAGIHVNSQTQQTEKLTTHTTNTSVRVRRTAVAIALTPPTESAPADATSQRAP